MGSGPPNKLRTGYEQFMNTNGVHKLFIPCSQFVWRARPHLVPRMFSSLTRRRKGTLIMEISTTSIRELPLSDQLFIQNIIDGKAIPPLYSDVAAKMIFNPDVHPDRLNFLMRRIAQDDTIDVASS